MADKNSITILNVGGKEYDLTPWGLIGTEREYYLTLLSRDEYTPVVDRQPTETDVTYIDPASEGLAVFHAGQCVAYPDKDMPDGWGLSIAKKVDVDNQNLPAKVYWLHLTDLEKRLAKLEDGIGKWHNGVANIEQESNLNIKPDVSK